MNPLLITLSLLVLISCQKDSGIDPNSKPTSLPDLSLGGTLQLLPIPILKDGKVAFFVSEKGEELALHLTYEHGTKVKTLGGTKYQSEFIAVDYDEKRQGSHFFPSIRVEESYNDYNSSAEGLFATLSTSYNGGFVPSITMYDKSTPLFWRFLESLTISNRTFENVYTNMVYPPEFDSYTKLYYTVEQGIVGFEGEQREMWALDRIE